MVNNERQTGRLISEKRQRERQVKLGVLQRGSLRKLQTYSRRRVVDCVFAIQKALTMDDNWVGHVPL